MALTELNKPASFIGNCPIIYDDRGLFYAKDGNVIFNLPAGNYDIYSAEYHGKPIRYRQPLQPFPERFRLKFKEPEIVVTSEIEGKPFGKAAICVSDDEIFFNSSARGLDTVSIMCLLMHELGHYHYHTEWKCDQFAFFKMLNSGYNPSQFKVFCDLLSTYSVDRMERAIKYLEKVDETANSVGSPWLRGL